MFYSLLAILLHNVSDWLGNIAWTIMATAKKLLIIARFHEKKIDIPCPLNDQHFFITLYLNEREEVTPRMFIAPEEKDIIFRCDPAGVLIFCKSIAEFRNDGLKEIIQLSK